MSAQLFALYYNGQRATIRIEQIAVQAKVGAGVWNKGITEGSDKSRGKAELRLHQDTDIPGMAV